MKSHIIITLFLFTAWADQAQTNQTPNPPPGFVLDAPAAQNKPPQSSFDPSEPFRVIQPNKQPPPIDFTTIKLPDPLITINGDSYSGAKIGSVSPADIGITYFDSEGVWRSKLVKITDLPDDLQKQFNYNTNAAAKYEAAQAKEDAKFVPRSGMSPSELRMYYYNSTIDRRIDEVNEQIAEEQAAERAQEEELKERSVEAQEEAARAATIQAFNPPVQQTTVIVH